MQVTARQQSADPGHRIKKPLVDGSITTKTEHQGLRTLNFVARLIRAHRRAIGSRWRRLTPADQALLVLSHLRKGETLTAAAAGFAVGTATAWRYIRETTALLAACADSLETVLGRACRRWGYVVIDGTLIACDRLVADRPFYSAKHERHGMNVQVVAAPDGALL